MVQLDFREGLSTATCLTSFLNDIIEETDGGGGCGVLFLVMTKFFNTVDLLIMEHKLRYLGFKTLVINWFTSYLNNSLQSTKVENSILSPMRVSCGVPRGFDHP